MYLQNISTQILCLNKILLFHYFFKILFKDIASECLKIFQGVLELKSQCSLFSYFYFRTCQGFLLYYLRYSSILITFFQKLPVLKFKLIFIVLAILEPTKIPLKPFFFLHAKLRSLKLDVERALDY